jgi:hypothetical protein
MPGDLVGKLRSLASTITSRATLATAAGLTFGGSRDVYEALGYQKILTVRDYRYRYQRNAIAGRIVEALPKATWRNFPVVNDDEDPKVETQFEADVTELDKNVNLWATLLRADILAGFGRYAVVLIGTPGNLESELPKGKSVENILYLSPFSEDDVSIKTLVSDATNSRYGLPDVYEFKRISATGESKTVHWSRVLHIADGILDEQIYGEPRLQRCWNLLDDLEKVTGAGAEAFWLRAHQGYQLDINPEVEMDPDDLTALQEEADAFVHNLRRYIRTQGVTLKALGSDVANFSNQVDAILTQISGGTGIPKRILVGSEMGELASTQDRTNWAERVIDRRTQYAAPQIVRPFLDRLLEYGYLSPAEGDDYQIFWPKIQDLDESQRATIAVQLSGLNQKAKGTIITAAEIRDHILDLPPLEEIGEVDEFEEEEDDGFIEEEAGLSDNLARYPVRTLQGDKKKDGKL